MSPLIPLSLLLIGITSVSAAFGLTMSKLTECTALLTRQDAFIATQVEMIRDRDTQLARKAAEVTTMAKFVRIIAEKRLRETQEGAGDVKGDDGAAEAVEPSVVPPEPSTQGTDLSQAQAYPHELHLFTPRTMEDMARDVMPSIAGGEQP